jgi:hypothetical protein
MKSPLKKLTHPDGHFVSALQTSGVFHVTSPHAFMQACGYLKFIFGKESPCRILYRGQANLYKSVHPTLYRDVRSQDLKSKRDQLLKAYVLLAQTNLSDVPTHAQEPLLQHYGIKTRWLDVVDNAWVALWFACHEAKVSGSSEKFLRFDKRGASKGKPYAYVILLRADEALPDPKKPGLIETQRTALIDLRVATPSIFIRPHSQHALLMRRSKGLDHHNTDYSDLVVGIIRIDLEQALTWLGEGTLLATKSLFPPPHYDYGYRRLLDALAPPPTGLGCIHWVSD